MIETKHSFDLQKFNDEISDTPDNAEESNQLNIESLSEEQLSELKTKMGFKTDDEVNAIIKSKHARWREELEQEKNEAARLAKLSEADKQKAIFEKEKEKFEKDRKEFREAQLFVEKEKNLVAEGLPASFASRIKGEEAEQILDDIKLFREEWDKAIQDEVNRRLVQKPQKQGAVVGSSLTKSQIMAIKDDEERTRAIASNKHLF